MQLLKYVNDANTHNPSELEYRVQQLTLLARALANEIESLEAQLSTEHNGEPVGIDDEGVDFYHEIERYEIELIKSALNYSGGNQTKAARLLHMKSTTLNAKMKHYGLNPARTITLHRPTHD